MRSGSRWADLTGMNMLLENMKFSEVQEYLENKKSIILPFGSMEQHGPHLPLGTDTILAAHIANEAGKRTNTIVAPALSVGFSPGLHTKFPGTISIGAQTYISFVLDVFESVIGSGFRDLLVITGHGMNIHPLKTAMLDYLNNHNARAIVLGYWELEDVAKYVEEGDGVHCTILETSMMLYLSPDLVEMEKGINEYRKARFLLGSSEIKQISNSGVIADTLKSSREKGQLIFEAAVNGLIKKVKLFDEGILFD